MKKAPKKAAKKVAAKKAIPTGWKCPECFTVHSPDVKECECVKRKPPVAPESNEEAKAKLRRFMEQWQQAAKERPNPEPPTLPPPMRPFYPPKPYWIPVYPQQPYGDPYRVWS